jgi:flagellar biosynthesis/type III secretory pathway protein FliH
LAEISKDEHERAKFMSRRKFETDMASNLLTAEERGRREGIKEGVKEGIKEGKKEGVKEGVRDMARKLKESGALPVEQISRMSGLTVSEIDEL